MNDTETPEARFATLGIAIDAAAVPSLVDAGYMVWSFGYGDDPEDFTVIQSDDLWAWSPEDADGDPAVVASWGPFRLDVSVLERVGLTVLAPQDISWGECPDRESEGNGHGPHEVALNMCVFCLEYDPE